MSKTKDDLMADIPTEPKQEAVPRDVYDALLKRLEVLESKSAAATQTLTGLGEWRKSEEKIKKKRIFLKLYTPDGSSESYPVVARAKTVYRKEMIKGVEEEVPYTTLTYVLPSGKEEQVTLKLTDYAKITDTLWTDVLEERVEKMEMQPVQSPFTRRVIHDADNYSSRTASRVPVYVTSEKRTFVVELPTGQKVTLQENVINGS